MGQRGRAGSLFSRALFWIALDLADGFFDRRRHLPVHLFRLFALDKQRRPATPTEELIQFLVLRAGGGRGGGGVGLLILKPLRCKIGRTAPSVIGLRNLLDCQAVAKGPVSASPSPTMQATMSPGLSNAAPNAWLSEYPSSPPSWMDPGVVGATWLEMPPGKENCLKSRFIPASSWLMSG